MNRKLSRTNGVQAIPWGRPLGAENTMCNSQNIESGPKTENPVINRPTQPVPNKHSIGNKFKSENMFTKAVLLWKTPL